MSIDQFAVMLFIFALFAARARNVDLAPATIIILSYVGSILIFISNPSWPELRTWLYTLIIKDLTLISLFGFMRGRHSFILMLTFVATCVFHQLILAQALTGKVDNLTLLALRPDLMKFIVICQLSTVYHAILTGGGIDGGKRAKCNLLFSDHRRHEFFCQQAFKAKR